MKARVNDYVQIKKTKEVCRVQYVGTEGYATDRGYVEFKEIDFFAPAACTVYAVLNEFAASGYDFMNTDKKKAMDYAASLGSVHIVSGTFTPNTPTNE